MRTSLTHPLQIAEVRPAPGMGKVGLTFCPGKKQKGAASGDWDRDLALDMATIENWHAAAVVTLVEEAELVRLGVGDIGDAVKDDYMAWYHLPIRDGGIPTGQFERMWQVSGAQLRGCLRAGFNVLVHCKGGLGRAGTIACRLLVELGMEPGAAVTAVRAVRPGAIETAEQLEYVLQQAAVPEPLPDRSLPAIRDRAVGALLGLAVGDAIGTTFEFTVRDNLPRLTDMVGGGPFDLQPGQWTDDTAMALALTDSLLADSQLDEADLMRRFVSWREEGAYSCTGTCFDIGMTTRQALDRFRKTGNPLAGSTDPRSAGNGSLMRLSPVAIRHWRDYDVLRDVAARQSLTTHGAPEAVAACVAWAEVLADAIAGEPCSTVLRSRSNYAGAIEAIMAGSWRGRPRDGIHSSGYVAHSLEAALWCIGQTGTFFDAVLLAANLGDDADTTAAITGQLAGALYGASRITVHWLDELAWSERIESVARQLFAASLR